MERVGIYNRCSTEEESQRNALAAQAMESREIAEKKGWIIAEQYIESETGTLACKRGEYQRLLADMEKDRFDIVMIKSIDRLMRSAKDWYFFLSRLTENRLKLYIYIEGKFYTPDDNLISGIKAILAEDFSRELSKKIKNAHRRRQEKKSGLNITCEMFGWNKLGKNLYELNEEEAACYRTAFRLAKEGKGFYTISNMMYDLGARTRKGGKISEVQWRKMLYTPRAHGTMILNTRSFNFDTKKYEKIPEEHWVYVENALPPIVSAEYQDEVLEILKRRAVSGKESGQKKMRPTQKYELSQKLICAECGNCYYRTGGKEAEKGGAVWKCSGFLKNGRTRDGRNPKGCDNPNVKEAQILSALEKELERTPDKGSEEKLIMDFLRILAGVFQGEGDEKELKRLTKERNKLKLKKDVLMEKLLSGVVSDQEFQQYDAELNKKLETLLAKTESINRKKQKEGSHESRIKSIRESIQKESLIKKAAARQLLKSVDHILIDREGGMTFQMKNKVQFYKHL